VKFTLKVLEKLKNTVAFCMNSNQWYNLLQENLRTQPVGSDMIWLMDNLYYRRRKLNIVFVFFP